jgi:GH24 family phage-related lysozyme (muramidase)
MNARSQITLDPETKRRAQSKATELGISFAEYVRRLIATDLGEPQRKADVSIIFNLIDEGPPTDIARDKDKMIGEAVWSEYLKERVRRAPISTAFDLGASAEPTDISEDKDK